MSEAELQQLWITDCLKWRGKVLTGENCHWCYDWDGLPVDETTPEWDCCACYTNAARRTALEGK
jgi:hypothetical protein